MKKSLFMAILLIALISCSKRETAIDILQATINSIDTIETIYYKQDMERTDPRNIDDTIFRYREIYLEKLVSDSIIGSKGHWYMYGSDNNTVTYEDIYDGNRLLRKNNPDSMVRLYDLIKYPAFKEKHFWSHNTLYGMQFEFKFLLDYADFYVIERLSDTIFDNTPCYQIRIILKDYVTMPGYAIKLEAGVGSISESRFFIDKMKLYPIRMKGEYYSSDNPDQRFFIDQRYYDIRFNIDIDENMQFNTTRETLSGFEIIEIKPE